MLVSRRTALSAALVGPLAVGTATSATAGPAAPASVAVRWQRVSIRTLFLEAGMPPPLAVVPMGVTSLAVHDAVRGTRGLGANAARAAVACAAHHVLRHYVPGSATALDAELADSLASIPRGPGRAKGMAVGMEVGHASLSARSGDGFNDTSVVYAKPPGTGVWQPAPGGAMAQAWLGFVRPLVATAPLAVGAPDPVGSAAYATDHEEVRLVGGAVSSERSPDEGDIARFFATFSPLYMYRDALCRLLDAEPMGLASTARLFAAVDAAVANAFITTWRLKFDVGFWRPFQAIRADDGDSRTVTDPTWSSFVPTPPYSDYSSGHAVATGPMAEVLRSTFGDGTSLRLHNRVLGVERSWDSLGDLEHDAFHARIWGGLHYRRAMTDGYDLAHRTAHAVMSALD